MLKLDWLCTQSLNLWAFRELLMDMQNTGMLELATDPCLILSARASPAWQVSYLGCISQDKLTMSQQCALVVSWGH